MHQKVQSSISFDILYTWGTLGIIDLTRLLLHQGEINILHMNISNLKHGQVVFLLSPTAQADNFFDQPQAYNKY